MAVHGVAGSLRLVTVAAIQRCDGGGTFILSLDGCDIGHARVAPRLIARYLEIVECTSNKFRNWSDLIAVSFPPVRSSAYFLFCFDCFDVRSYMFLLMPF